MLSKAPEQIESGDMYKAFRLIRVVLAITERYIIVYCFDSKRIINITKDISAWESSEIEFF